MPNRWTDLLYRLKALLFGGRMEREMSDEVAFHLEMETEKYRRQGMSEADARRLAERKFGGVVRQREAAREAWGISFWSDLTTDLRRGARRLWRSPGFALATIVTLALGIGATTAIFSLAWRVLGDRPPVEDPGSLVAIYTTCRRGSPQCSSSWPDYEDYRDRTRTLVGAAAFSSIPLNVGTAEGARLATGHVVTGDFFPLLGVRAHLGRLITPQDNRRGSAAPVVVVSEELWRSLLGADSTVLGETVHLNGAPFTIVGVAAAGFRGLSLENPADVWIPIFAGGLLGQSVGSAGSGDGVFDARGNRWIGTIIGRRRPGASIAQVRQEMDALAQALGEEFPAERAAVGGVRGITVDPIEGYILPLGSEADLERFLKLLLAVVGVTLVLASVNVANLLLARASSRHRELGVQLAMGARRGRIVRQLLTESTLLGVIGGGAGLLVAVAVLNALGAYELPGGVSIGALSPGLDARVLTFALVVSLVSAIGFGLAPALRSTRRDLVAFIKGDTSSGGDGQGVRRGLIGLQVALCLVLLVGSGLFVRTLRNSLAESLGFHPHGAVAARFNLTMLRYGVDESLTFGDELTRRVRALPGVRSAGIGTLVPFQRGGFRGIFAEIPGYEPAPDEEIRFDWVVVTPGYFDALGMALLEGRVFDDGDRSGSRPVVVVNRHAAQRFWPGRSAIGQTLRFFDTTHATVVGVIDDPTWGAVGEDHTPFVFISRSQYPSAATDGFQTLVARTTGSVDALLPMVRRAVREVEPGLSLAILAPLDDLVGSALMTQRVGSLLLTSLSLLALVLATVGIYGVVGYAVARQAREIGIRMALGAGRRQVVLSVVRGITVPVLVGLSVGLAAALLLGQTVAAFMYGVEPRDPFTLVTMATLLTVAALIAMLLPARRALRLDPVSVLNSE